jgi:capsular polysaccharide transport system permease protein
MRGLGSIFPKLRRHSAVLQKTVTPVQQIAAGLQDRSKRLGLLMKIFVFAPTAAIFVYLLLVHSDMYLSSSMFAVRSGGMNPTAVEGVGGLGSLFGSILPGGGSDSQIVLAYITSAHMMDSVGKDIDLLAHYADRGRDIWSRLWRKPTREELIAYWQWLLKASYDIEKGIISVEVKGYDPETARAVNAAVLKQSELFVNDMNARANEDAVRLSVQEIARSEKRVADAAAAIRIFRDSRATLDPVVTARGLEGVVSALETEAAAAGAKLLTAQKLMRDDSLGVAELKDKLDSLQAQILREKARLAGVDAEKGTISAIVEEYSSLQMEEQFANKQLVAAMGMYEMARITATAQARYIVPIQPPTLPEESEYPRVFLFTLLGFVAFLTAFGLVSLSVASIRDHMGV